MSKIQDKSTYFQDIPIYAQRHTSEDDPMNSLLELIQRVGPEKVHQLIQMSENASSAGSDWDQNFF